MTIVIKMMIAMIKMMKTISVEVQFIRHNIDDDKSNDQDNDYGVFDDIDDDDDHSYDDDDNNDDSYDGVDEEDDVDT